MKLKDMMNEANRGKVFKAARRGSYPAVIVVTQNGKVVHQEPVSTPELAPAKFNVMQEKYPKALLYLEDSTGKRLFSEGLGSSLKEAFKKDGHIYNHETVGTKNENALAGKDGILGNNGVFISWEDVRTLQRKYRGRQ